MLEKYLDSYVEELYNRQNQGALPEQQNLFSKQDYYQLLRPVIEVINTYKDHSIKELRDKLYELSGIEEKVKDFVYDREMVPGMVCSYGTNNYRETFIIGNRQEVILDENGRLVPAIEKMTLETINDLASNSKVFTSLSCLILARLGLINYSDKITYYEPRFANIKNVSIADLANFMVPLKTSKRMDDISVRTKGEAEELLFSVEVDNSDDGSRPYTDIGAMVLKYVIEKASGMSYYDFVYEYILKKLGMTETYVTVPKSKIDRVASTNFAGRYFKGDNFSITTNVLKGIAHDSKAQIMGQISGNLSGHAGLFSTMRDMTTFARGLINNQLINKEYLAEMARNKTGRVLRVNDKGEKEYVQYLGSLCYSKNPILGNSEVLHALSGKSFASAGWTGNQLTIDPVNELFFVLNSNRSHNRMVAIDPTHRNEVQIDAKGKKTIMLPNGDIKIDSTRFAWERDSAVVHPAIKLAMQYQMLEKIFSYEKEINTSEENIRYL